MLHRMEEEMRKWYLAGVGHPMVLWVLDRRQTGKLRKEPIWKAEPLFEKSFVERPG